MMPLHDVPAVELVPQDPVVEVRRVLHHVGGVALPGEDGVLVDVPLPGQALPHHPVEVRHHQVAAVVLRRPHQGAGGVRGDPVVAVQELEVGPPGGVQGPVPGGGDAGVRLVQRPHPGVLGGVAVAEGAGAVGAAVLHQQQLKIRVLLVQDAVHTAGEGLFGPIDRDDDTDGRIHKSSFGGLSGQMGAVRMDGDSAAMAAGQYASQARGPPH